jgi:ABC-type sugar transport system ATPase subunit
VADIRVENLRKTFGSLVAVDDITFNFSDSRVTCLLGPSGCGKTTLMRIIAGLEQPTAGDVYFGDRRVTHLAPSKREIGMVFQYPVVYRGISVYRNIELPLLSDKLSKAERTQRVEEVIQLLGLGPSAHQEVSTLDNGTRQKVAVAREVARQPQIILFDEPITNVDANAKLQLKRAFKELTRRLSQTIVYVTHDQTEAMTLADQIALMRDGQIVQCDAPRTLYNHPADQFGGWFLGNPGMVFFDAATAPTNTGSKLSSPVLAAPWALTSMEPLPKSVIIGIRPEQIVVSPTEIPDGVPSRLRRKSIQIGGQYLLTLEVAGATDRPFKAKVDPQVGHQFDPPADVWVQIPANEVTLFDSNGHRLPATINQQPAPSPVAAREGPA